MFAIQRQRAKKEIVFGKDQAGAGYLLEVTGLKSIRSFFHH